MSLFPKFIPERPAKVAKVAKADSVKAETINCNDNGTARIVNGELICLSPVDDLAPVIIDLTKDDFPEQKRLLRLHCQKHTSKSHFWNLALKWEVKTCLFESKGYPLERAELLAAEELGLLAFMDELKQPQQ